MSSGIILKDAFKKFTVDQDKTLPPEVTVKKIKDKLEKIGLNILKRTERIDNGRLNIPVFFSYCGKDAINIMGSKKQMGKGAAPTQAEASAVMELAERFSFFSFKKTPSNFFSEKYINIKEKAIGFDMIAKSVHDNSDDLDLTKDIFENLTLNWTKGYNLTRNQETIVPFNWFFAINEFNGPSAGNCTEEAVLQGICEVVERHVSSKISQNRLQVPLIQPDSATDPMVVEMLQKYNNAGINIYISDFSLDTGIPTVGILAHDPATFPEKSEIVWTAGTTPDPEKALSRALTETAQLGGNFNTGSNYMESGLPKFSDMSETGFITAGLGKEISIKSLPNISDNNIRVEIENCISALYAKGMDIIIVDTTHPVLNVPAFYTVIPGAHFRERAAGTSVGMFSAKIITETQEPFKAFFELEKIDKKLGGKYYIKFYLGTCCLKMGDLAAALKYFAAALDLEPAREDIASIYSYMGACLKDMGEYRKAIDVLKKGENIDKQRTDIYNLKGFCYFKLKEHEKAISCFKKIIALDPGSAIDYANIASNYRDMGKKSEAIQYYEMALAIDPAIDFAIENLAKIR